MLLSIYAQLRTLASRQLRRIGGSPTLSTTVLVHEAYERLAGAIALVRRRQAKRRTQHQLK